MAAGQGTCRVTYCLHSRGDPCSPVYSALALKAGCAAPRRAGHRTTGNRAGGTGLSPPPARRRPPVKREPHRPRWGGARTVTLTPSVHPAPTPMRPAKTSNPSARLRCKPWCLHLAAVPDRRPNRCPICLGPRPNTPETPCPGSGLSFRKPGRSRPCCANASAISAGQSTTAPRSARPRSIVVGEGIARPRDHPLPVLTSRRAKGGAIDAGCCLARRQPLKSRATSETLSPQTRYPSVRLPVGGGGSALPGSPGAVSADSRASDGLKSAWPARKKRSKPPLGIRYPRPFLRANHTAPNSAQSVAAHSSCLQPGCWPAPAWDPGAGRRSSLNRTSRPQKPFAKQGIFAGYF